MKKVLGALAVCAVLGAAAPAGADASTARYCGTVNNGFPGVVAGKVTTCAFARNVARTYTSSRASVVWAWSPATGRGYRMWCRNSYGRYNVSVLCTGGNAARVRLVS
jgi:hypothetical protein